MTTTSARLAIDGGTPVRTSFLPYAHQQISDDDVAAVVAALRSDWLTTGPRVPEFEAGLVAATGAKHAVAYSSGTAALHGAAAVAGLGPGDEAITSPMTFAATANCVLYCGAEPRFADVRPGSLLIDPELVAAAITPRTKALLPIDYAGHPADFVRSDRRRRSRLAGRDARWHWRREARGHDRAQPPPGEDPHDR